MIYVLIIAQDKCIEKQDRQNITTKYDSFRNSYWFSTYKKSDTIFSMGGDSVDVPARLKQLMEERGMNVYALAQASDVSWQTVKNIFTLTSNPSVGTLQKICRGLGVTLSQFFATEEDGNIITLTAEQQHVIDRWNVMPADKQRVFSELLDMLSNENN